MKKKELSINLLQTSLFWKNKDKNLQKFTQLIQKDSQTDIVLLPEMFNTSFCPEYNSLAESMEGETIMWMKKIAKNNKIAIAGTLMIKEDNKIYNRLVWVHKNGNISTYDKYHLFSLINEQKFIQKGEKKIILKEAGWKICPMICYDLRFPVFSRNQEDYDMLIYLANWPIKRIEAWNTLLKARSIENQCYTIGVNRIGEDGNGITFNGNSCAFDAFGNKMEIVLKSKEVLKITLSYDKLELNRRQMNFLQDRDKFTIL